MNKGQTVFMSILATLGVAVFVALIFFAMVMSFRNDIVALDNTITAQVSDMKASYNTYFTKVKEAAQVPQEQMAQLKEFYDKVVTGRSTDGAMFKFIAESNPNIDQSTYVEIQRIIAAGRADIYDIQKVHIDTVREYNTRLVTWPNSSINDLFFHFISKEPTLPIASNVDLIFETKQDKPIEIFGK